MSRLTNRIDEQGRLVSEEHVDDGLDMGPPPRLIHMQLHVDQEDDTIMMPAYAEPGGTGVAVVLFDSAKHASMLADNQLNDLHLLCLSAHEPYAALWNRYVVTFMHPCISMLRFLCELCLGSFQQCLSYFLPNGSSLSAIL